MSDERPIILDESAMLRYLLNDNKKQAREVRRYVTKGIVYTYPELIARVAVTLRDTYNVPRKVIGEALSCMLDDIIVGEEDSVRLACRLFGTTNHDFTDCLLIARNTLRGYRVLSFDKGKQKRLLP